MGKLTFREMNKISKVLTKNETKLFYQFELEVQHELYNMLLDDEEKFKQEFRTVALQFRDDEEEYKETNKEVDKKENKKETKVNNFFATQGITDPSDVTKKAFGSQNITANFNKLYNAIGMLTLNLEKQAQFNFYDVQARQNFIMIAQNDAIIKQNEKLIEQNDQMIELMKMMANK